MTLLLGCTHHVPSANRATTTPLPNLPDPRKPALRTVRMARPLALARIFGGMILSGPKDCRGSTKEARMRPVFLHSPVQTSQLVLPVPHMRACVAVGWGLTPHGRGQRVVKEGRHLGCLLRVFERNREDNENEGSARGLLGKHSSGVVALEGAVGKGRPQPQHR